MRFFKIFSQLNIHIHDYKLDEGILLQTVSYNIIVESNNGINVGKIHFLIGIWLDLECLYQNCKWQCDHHFCKQLNFANYRNIWLDKNDMSLTISVWLCLNISKKCSECPVLVFAAQVSPCVRLLAPHCTPSHRNQYV